MLYYNDMKKTWNLTIKIYTFVDDSRRRSSWKGEKCISGVWQRYIATENTQQMLTFVHRCRRSCRFLKGKKYLYKYKGSNRNTFIYTYPVHQFFVSSFAGSTSWRVYHHQSDEHRVGELGMGIYFGILHHIHYKYIPFRHHVSRASSYAYSVCPLKNMKCNIREQRIPIHITQCLFIYLLRFIY
jgi:hypothetical protein